MKAWLNKAKELLKDSITPPRNELNELDWKLSISPDKAKLTQHIAAFANYSGGGFLIYGIKPEGAPVQISDTEASNAVNQIANLGRHAVDPAIQIDHACEEFESIRLLFIHIPESPTKPVHLKGKGVEYTFIRSGGTTRPASRPEVAGMLMNSKTPSWEELNASHLLGNEDLNGSILELKPIFAMLGRPQIETGEEQLKWLEGEKFINRVPSGGGYITNLGAISAARHLADFEGVSRKAVRVVHYRGINKLNTVGEITGGKGYAIGFQGLIGYVMSELPKSEVIREALRSTQPIYPEIALREIIANALIHQDFSVTGTSPMIEIYDDRIEISNPGRLLSSKQPDRLIGTQGESRNEKLAKAFRMYRICEERGSGLFKAASECELYGLPPIKFINGENYFRVILFSPRSFAQMTEKERIDACYQHAVLKYLSSDFLTNKSLRERLNMPEKQRSMVSLLIQQAVTSGKIKPADPDNKSKKFTEYVPYWVK